MPITTRSQKRNHPEHNTPPKEKNEKKNKPNYSDTRELEDTATHYYICDRCTDYVEDLIQCERCEMWLCAKCEKVPPELIHHVSQYCELRVHWFCKVCDKLALHSVQTYSHMSNPFTKEITSCFNDTVVKSLNKMVERIDVMLNEMLSSFSDLHKSLEDRVIATSPTDTTVEVVNENTENVVALKSESLSSAVNDQVFSIVNEISDRDSRKCNLMIHNLPEPELSSAQERVSADTKTVEALLKDKLSISDPKICKVLRLGKHKSDRSRSVLIVFDDEKTKWTCLKHAPRLRNDPAFQRVYLSPDLTVQERKERRKLLTELKNRKEKGEKDIIIRHGRVVKRTPRNLD